MPRSIVSALPASVPSNGEPGWHARAASPGAILIVPPTGEV